MESVFHRVIEGFMAQTGDPDGNGTGGSGKNLKAEFSDYEYKYGTVGMASDLRALIVETVNFLFVTMVADI